jgi:hypothetical protein
LALWRCRAEQFPPLSPPARTVTVLPAWITPTWIFWRASPGGGYAKRPAQGAALLWLGSCITRMGGSCAAMSSPASTFALTAGISAAADADMPVAVRRVCTGPPPAPLDASASRRPVLSPWQSPQTWDFRAGRAAEIGAKAALPIQSAGLDAAGEPGDEKATKGRRAAAAADRLSSLRESAARTSRPGTRAPRESPRARESRWP